MKVSTDACIQGAWAAAWLALQAQDPLRVLDIGSGTGLLSLMLAQQHLQARIEAIELHADAFAQSQENFAASPWAERLGATHISLQDFTTADKAGAYDFIICNPPFFHNQLQSAEKGRNEARHSVTLTKRELAEAMVQLLREYGTCCVLYPQSEWADWLLAAAAAGLQEIHTLLVQPSAHATPNRVIGMLGKKNNEAPRRDTLVIYDQDKTYTKAFAALLQPYYLAL